MRIRAGEVVILLRGRRPLPPAPCCQVMRICAGEVVVGLGGDGLGVVVAVGVRPREVVVLLGCRDGGLGGRVVVGIHAGEVVVRLGGGVSGSAGKRVVVIRFVVVTTKMEMVVVFFLIAFWTLDYKI